MTGRLGELDRLMSEIHREVEAGERVPCVDPQRGHWWLSEDREQAEAASHACGTCPALAACRRYIEQHPEPAGVWAGVLPRQFNRRRQSGRSQGSGAVVVIPAATGPVDDTLVDTDREQHGCDDSAIARVHSIGQEKADRDSGSDPDDPLDHTATLARPGSTSDSFGNHGEACRLCGQPLLIPVPGRDVCEMCRLERRPS